MKTIKQTNEYIITQRRDGRYAVRGKDKRPVNGESKVEILVKEGLLKQDAPKAKPPAEDVEARTEERPVEEATSEDTPPETADEEEAKDES